MPHARSRLLTTYVVEGILSFAGNLLFIGIFFYTTNVFKWDLRRNFTLAAAQGVVYVIASLLTQKLAKTLGDRNLLIAANVALAAVSAVGTLANSQTLLVAVILIYVPLLAFNWPVLEAMVSADADPHEMSRRIGMYNLIWAGTGALAVAIQGTLIKYNPRGVFFLPLLIHLACLAIFLLVRSYGTRGPGHHEHAALAAEPQLVRQRTLALWLSRISLPSTYVVIYSLSALMPLLPVMQRLDPTAQTAVASIWMVTRWIIFWLLGATVFWHTRPRLLLWAAVLMLMAFLGMTVDPRRFLDVRLPPNFDLWSLVFWQLLLGAALGMIYTASLYFGMVLSQASTEHAGYHEALIGVGQIAGPALGVATQILWPGSLLAGAAAVASIIVVSIAGASVAAIKARSRD